MIPTLRTLTMKSKLGFGKHKDLTVRRIIDLNRQLDLVSAYYKLTSINFTEDVLMELKIFKDMRIPKPSSNREMYEKYFEVTHVRKQSRRFNFGSKTIINKAYLQSKNQGK